MPPTWPGGHESEVGYVDSEKLLSAKIKLPE